jgi:cephalosporin hydroxylase
MFGASAIKEPKRIPVFVAYHLYNAVVNLRRPPILPEADSVELEEIRVRARNRTDISDHLPLLFGEAMQAKPRLIVELGVRGGESTFVFERVARLCDSVLLSVDIEDCSLVSAWDRWHFVREDDVAFAERFEAWSREHDLEPVIDVLFIDTSHLYEHTKQEIAAWLPFVAEDGRVFFHDTNLKPVYFRKDGSMGLGWQNDRGVIRAVEEHFNVRFDEKHDFIDARDGWLIRHYANCSGLTTMHRGVLASDN